MSTELSNDKPFQGNIDKLSAMNTTIIFRHLAIVIYSKFHNALLFLTNIYCNVNKEQTTMFMIVLKMVDIIPDIALAPFLNMTPCKEHYYLIQVKGPCELITCWPAAMSAAMSSASSLSLVGVP